MKYYIYFRNILNHWKNGASQEKKVTEIILEVLEIRIIPEVRIISKTQKGIYRLRFNSSIFLKGNALWLGRAMQNIECFVLYTQQFCQWWITNYLAKHRSKCCLMLFCHIHQYTHSAIYTWMYKPKGLSMPQWKEYSYQEVNRPGGKRIK